MTTQRPTRTNRVPTINPRGKWSNESLEIAMDAIECGITSFLGANKFWGILVTSFSDHLNGKTRSRKIEPLGVLTKEENEVVAWVFQYVGMWVVHNIATIQMEVGRSYSNSTHPILKWGAWGFLVVLV
jgi:hypothetical protein